MKRKLLALMLVISVSSFAQEITFEGKTKQVEGNVRLSDAEALVAQGKVKKEIDQYSWEEVEYMITGGKLEKTTTKYIKEERGIGNAAGFFADNIVFPVKPGVEITNLNQITSVDQLKKEVQDYVKNAQELISKGYALETDKVEIVSEASSVRATTDVPSGYSQAMVNASYKDPKNPSNEELASNRGKALAYVVQKFILLPYYQRSNQLAEKSTQNKEAYKARADKARMIKNNIKVSSSVKSQKKIAIHGLDFVKDVKIVQKEVQNIPELTPCGKRVSESGKKGTLKGPHGDYMISYKTGKYTKAIQLGQDKGNVSLFFDSKTVPDRAVITYGGKVVIDTGYIGGMGQYKSTQLREAIMKKKYPKESDRIKRYNLLSNPSFDTRYEIWKELLEIQGITATGSLNGGKNASKVWAYHQRSKGKSFGFTADGSATVAYVYIYGPLDTTIWDMELSCPK